MKKRRECGWHGDPCNVRKRERTEQTDRVKPDPSFPSLLSLAFLSSPLFPVWLEVGNKADGGGGVRGQKKEEKEERKKKRKKVAV